MREEWDLNKLQLQEFANPTDCPFTNIWVISGVLDDERYAIGYTVIQIEGEETVTKGYFYGAKIKSEHRMLSSVVFSIGLKEVKKKLQDRKATVKVQESIKTRRKRYLLSFYADYMSEITDWGFDRWMQYAAPQWPMPQREEVNGTLRDLTTNTEIVAIGLLNNIA